MEWDILAEDDGCTTNALIAKFHEEILAHRGEVPDFASFRRVACMRYPRRCAMVADTPAETASETPHEET